MFRNDNRTDTYETDEFKVMWCKINLRLYKTKKRQTSRNEFFLKLYEPRRIMGICDFMSDQILCLVAKKTKENKLRNC